MFFCYLFIFCFLLHSQSSLSVRSNHDEIYLNLVGDTKDGGFLFKYSLYIGSFTSSLGLLSQLLRDRNVGHDDEREPNA